MLSESRIEPSENMRVRPEIYVKEKLAEHLDVFADEVANEDEVTNAQARSLMADAERYFDFPGFIHKATFLEEDARFTVLQCIKLIRLQLGEYNYLLGR